MSACSAKQTSGVQVEKTAINVEVASVAEESLDGITNLSGKLLPYEETDVSFEVAGRIQNMDANIGDPIQAGNSLANLDPADYQLQVQQADNAILQSQAALDSSDAAINSAEVGIGAADSGVSSSNESIKSAEANIKAANARISSAQANLEAVNKGAREQEKAQARLAVDRAKAAYTKAKLDADRIKGLYDEGLASKKDFDDMQLVVTNAQKDVANAEQSLSLILEGATAEQRKQAASSIQEAEAGKEQAVAGKGQATAAKGQAISAREQAVASKEQAIAARGQSEAAYEQALIGKKQAELTLSKTQLKSPLTGVVLEKLISEGQMVSPGTPVYKLGRTDQLKVLLPVPDKEIKDWTAGQEVTVSLYDQKRTGKVNKIYPQTNASTGTISVEVIIPNENLEWVPGQVVRANRVTSDNKGILIPIEAVISSGNAPYVFKEVKGHAVKTEVQTGNLIDNKIHIMSGLKVGDIVVIRGGELLLDGDPLETGRGKTK
ncbi:efflux RND transporter periplasmic adaptor subunit [Peribacillus saganii]|uniref:Efflux RND transporter periplasmic adaptor subunit n=2 Tax=Peribacillus saganii TaxID=2303992 RepID=A0A372LNI9_9BACI|nr:efflux RND transporter periplasmic adaptor subunit [Peribacillus saganii]